MMNLRSLTRFALVAAILSAGLSAFAQEAKPWTKIPIPRLHDFKPQQPTKIMADLAKLLFSAPSVEEKCLQCQLNCHAEEMA